MRIAVAPILLLVLFGCSEKHEQQTATQPPAAGAPSATHGEQLITQYGCSSCHTVPGIKGPKGVVGPPLDKIGSRPFIASGKVQNTPQNMVTWLQNPQAFDPGNAMPNLGVTENDARDLAAFLYTLK